MSEYRLDPPQHTLNGFINRTVRAKHRPTVSLVLILPDSGVLLVQSAQDVTGQTWIFPQGGVGHETLDAAARREAKEELGLPAATLQKRHVLGQKVNVLPPERKELDKLIIFVASRISSARLITLNDENTAHQSIHSPYELWSIMGDMSMRRPWKFLMTCAAINAAYEQGLIGWSCQEIMPDIMAAASAA